MMMMMLMTVMNTFKIHCLSQLFEYWEAVGVWTETRSCLLEYRD